MNRRELLLDEKTMREFYGSFYSQGGNNALDRSKVPQELWDLLPYASFWGISDDKIRDHLVHYAPSPIKANLKAAVQAFDHLLDLSLAGPEALDPQPSKEYVAFTSMRMAADYV